MPYRPELNQIELAAWTHAELEEARLDECLAI